MRFTAQQKILASLIVASLAIFFWGLGSIPLLSFNEARRAVPVREMLATGDWILPTLNAQLYISKPPLLYWLSALPALVFASTSEWIVRLPSALAALGTTWLLFFSMRSHFGVRVACLTVAVLITSAGFTTFARRAEIEMLLATCCFGSVLAAYEYVFSGDRRWLNAAFAFLGLALLAKGPVALLFYVPVLLVFWLRYREPRALTCLTHWRGWGIALLIALPWYLLVSHRLGWDIWQKVIETDMAGKVGIAKRDPLYQYPLWLLGDFLPWILLLFVRPRKTISRLLSTPKQGYFLIAAIVPLVVFSLIANKHAKYLLPAYPAWAALLALSADDFYERLGAKGRRSLLTAAVLTVAGFLAYFAVLEPRVLKHRYSVFPKIATTLARHPELPVYTLDEVDPRIIYYYGKPMKALAPEELDSELQQSASFLLFVEDDAPPASSQAMCPIAEFAPYLRRGHKASIWGAGTACSTTP